MDALNNEAHQLLIFLPSCLLHCLLDCRVDLVATRQINLGLSCVKLQLAETQIDHAQSLRDKLNVAIG